MLEWYSECVINWRLIELSSDCSVPAAHGPKLVTTALTVWQLCSLWTPGSICTWFCSYNPVLTFLFTGRDAAITMNMQCTLGVASTQLFQPIVLLHAVRSAITAIAELLVTSCSRTFSDANRPILPKIALSLTKLSQVVKSMVNERFVIHRPD